MKRFKNFIPFLFIFFSVSAQNDPVLLVINGEEIKRSEFEYLFNKNNFSTHFNKEFLKDYLKLFINYKLKVGDAESAGLDKSPAFRSELEGYRQDLVKDYFMKYIEKDLSINPVQDNYEEKKVLVKQIFKYLPQNSSSLQQRETEYLMDSLYSVLTDVPLSDFDYFVDKYSDDKEERWIERLELPAEIEENIFSLNKNQISSPFYSPAGIHIVKVIDIKDDISSHSKKISGNNHQYNTDLIIQKLKKEYNFLPNETGINELIKSGYTDKVLFSLENNLYTNSDFVRFTNNKLGNINKQLNDFINKSVFDYAVNSFEKTFPEFKYLMQEYHDGILLFEISNKEVWHKALSDEEGLKSYFEKNRKKYAWKSPRYKGLVIHTDDKKIIKQIKKITREIPMSEWEEIINKTFNYDGAERVKIEEGVFSVGDNKYIDKLIFKKGKFTPLPTHPYTIAIGTKLKLPETYQEIYQQVVVDYQDYLEDVWLKRLNDKSKVEINQEVLKTVNNHSSN